MKSTPDPQDSDLQNEGLSPERRARILVGAARIFVAEGYEGASMSQIAGAADVSKGTLYNYFPSKQALFAAFVRDRCSLFLQEVFGEMLDDAPIAPELKRIGLIMLKLMTAATGQAVFRVVVMEAAKFPDLAKIFLSMGPEAMVGRLSAWLAVQDRAGRLQTENPDLAAWQFFALTQARLVMRCRCDPSFKPGADEVEQVLDGAVRVFLAAYSPQRQ